MRIECLIIVTTFEIVVSTKLLLLLLCHCFWGSPGPSIWPGVCGFVVDLIMPGKRGKGTIISTVKTCGEGAMPQKMLRRRQVVLEDKNNSFPPFLTCKTLLLGCSATVRINKNVCKVSVMQQAFLMIALQSAHK